MLSLGQNIQSKPWHDDDEIQFLVRKLVVPRQYAVYVVKG